MNQAEIIASAEERRRELRGELIEYSYQCEKVIDEINALINSGEATHQEIAKRLLELSDELVRKSAHEQSAKVQLDGIARFLAEGEAA